MDGSAWPCWYSSLLPQMWHLGELREPHHHSPADPSQLGLHTPGAGGPASPFLSQAAALYLPLGIEQATKLLSTVLKGIPPP